MYDKRALVFHVDNYLWHFSIGNDGKCKDLYIFPDKKAAGNG